MNVTADKVRPGRKTKLMSLSSGGMTWVRVKPPITPNTEEMLIIAKGLKRELLAIIEPAFDVMPGLCLRALKNLLRDPQALQEASQRRFDLTLADILANGWGYGGEISDEDTEESIGMHHQSRCYNAMQDALPLLLLIDKLPFEVIEAEAAITWNENHPMMEPKKIWQSEV
ncbi:hypothetical protein [Cerasicoccus fimbriatus]|uniref:hypothetical protein n=1 Tax=Cerasicoccus fimbriatus TaxID=3014554 RepID=UPI0022B2E573|nr:hypothetical protein [Cerasicoccus sp. TK19100]